MATTQRHEIDAFLGEDEHYTDEQRDQIADEYGTWERTIGADIGDDQQRQDEGIAALTAVARRVAGDLDLDELANVDRAAQQSAATARAEVKAAVVVLVLAGELSESEAARRAGVTRMTVRDWLGK